MISPPDNSRGHHTIHIELRGCCHCISYCHRRLNIDERRDGSGRSLRSVLKHTLLDASMPKEDAAAENEKEVRFATMTSYEEIELTSGE